MDDEIFLSGDFQQYPECKKTYAVRLGSRNLIFEEKLDAVTYTKLSKGFTSVLLKDVVCARLYQSKLADDTAAYFQMIAYPMSNSGRKKATKRKRSVLTFRVNDSDDCEGNTLIAETWARTLEWLIANQDLKPQELEELESFPPKKRILVLVNPRSGNGQSLAKFRKLVEPIFKDAGIFYKEIVTRRANHGMDIAYEMNLEEWDGIAICSGDGLAYEVVQGFMQRDDWEAAIKTPIGMIPTGSGNSLCAAVLYAAKDVFDIVSAAFNIVRGRPYPIDLCSIKNNKSRMFAFLSLTWGIISDIDIESERLRLLGNARFTAGAIYKILAFRVYGGRISFLQCDADEKIEIKGGEDLPVCNSSGRSSSRSSGCSFSHSRLHNEEAINTSIDHDELEGGDASKENVAKSCPPTFSHTRLHSEEENTANIWSVSANEADVSEGGQKNSHREVDSTKKKELKSQTGLRRGFSVASNMFKRTASSKYGTIEENNDSSFGESIGESNDTATANSNGRERRAFSTTELEIGKLQRNLENGKQSHFNRPVHGPVDTLVPEFEDPVPEDWVVSEGEFVTVIIMLISHLGSNLLTCPDLKLGDGKMELLFAKKGTSRKAMIDILRKMETGDHVSVKDLKIHRIKAFRLELGTEKEGYLALDGENIDYRSVQGQVHKGLGRVFLCC